ncbi:MAG: hypothetical protein JWM80_6505 [Cyanobacteria bacterium RYN_339]|nr:hypothetical protein [Cyanobacteria bacterium RYN_339]
MGDVKTGTGNLEAARQAAEAAAKRQQAEMERQRLAKLASDKAGKPAEVDKQTFVQDAQLATTDQKQREDLFARFDQDHNNSLSDNELDALFAQEAPAQHCEVLSDGVQGDLDYALQDDKDTGEDFSDAAGHVKTADDVDAVLAAAEAKGMDPQVVLQDLLKAQDEGAETPNQAVFDRIADHMDRLGNAGQAAATRAAGDPAVSKDVREHLTQSLQDGKDTASDLEEAAHACKTPQDLQAVLGAQTALCQSSPDVLLKKALQSLDVDADTPNAALLNEVAAQYEKLGKPELADAARSAANPAVSKDVRKQLLYALRDDKDTAKDIRKALEAAHNEVDTNAGVTTGDATLGAEHTAELEAVAEVKDAQDVYDKALDKCKDANETLQLAMQEMAGMPPDQQKAFVDAFKAKHPEYKALDEAQQHLAETVTKDQVAIGNALQRGDQLSEVDAGALEKALKISAQDPAGLDAAKAIATAVLQNAANVPEKRLKMISEEVLPEVFNAEITRAIGANGGDPAAAMQAFVDSDLGHAIDQAKEVYGDLKPFKDGITKLNEALKAKDAAAAGQVIEDAAGSGSKLGVALGAAGLVTGVLAFANADGFVAHAQAALSLASNSAEVIGKAGKAFASLGETLPLESLEKAGPVLAIVAGAVSGIKDFMDGNYVAAGADGITVALGVLALTTEIPGLNVAALIVAGGLMIWKSWSAGQEHEKRINEIKGVMKDIGVEDGLATFLTNSDAGAYTAVKKNLGLDDKQIAALVKSGSPWTKQLDNFASPDFKDNVLPKLEGTMPGALTALSAGLGSDGTAYVSQVLAAMSVPARDPVTGEPVDKKQQLNNALTAMGASGAALTPEEHQRAIENLYAAFGLE